MAKGAPVTYSVTGTSSLWLSPVGSTLSRPDPNDACNASPIRPMPELCPGIAKVAFPAMKLGRTPCATKLVPTVIMYAVGGIR